MKVDQVLADHALAEVLLANREEIGIALRFIAVSLMADGSRAEARAYLKLYDEIQAAAQ